MKLEFSKRFVRSLEAAPPEVREGIQAALKMFRVNPKHPALNFEKIGTAGYWSIRVDQGWRVMMKRLSSGEYRLVEAGPHDVYRAYRNRTRRP